MAKLLGRRAPPIFICAGLLIVISSQAQVLWSYLEPDITIPDLLTEPKFPYVKDPWGHSLIVRPGSAGIVAGSGSQHFLHSRDDIAAQRFGPDSWLTDLGGGVKYEFSPTGHIEPWIQVENYHLRTLAPTQERSWTFYSIGPNGIDEGGLGDDVLVREPGVRSRLYHLSPKLCVGAGGVFLALALVVVQLRETSRGAGKEILRALVITTLVLGVVLLVARVADLIYGVSLPHGGLPWPTLVTDRAVFVATTFAATFVLILCYRLRHTTHCDDLGPGKE